MTEARDLTKGPLARHLLALAPPAAASQLLISAFEFIDAYWTGRLAAGSAALAALGVGTYALWSLFSIGHIVESSTLALCARALGEQDRAKAVLAADRGAVFAVAMWIASLIFLLPAVPLVADLTGVVGTTRTMAIDYLGILVAGSITLYGFAALDAVFRAAGDTRTPMLLLVGGLAINAVLDPLLMNGGAGVPAFGLAGAAWATVSTRLLCLVAGTVILARRGLILRTPVAALRRLAPYQRYLKIGVPAGSTGFLYCITFMAIARVLAPWGEDAIAATAAGQRIESASWSIMFGVGTVAGAIVGQCLGAGLHDRARAGTRLALQSAAISGLLFGTLYFLVRDPLIAFIAPNQPGVLTYGRAYLLAVAAAQVFMAVELVLQQALTGAGDTVPPMLIIVSLTAARIPLAWWMAGPLDLGPPGVFWAFTISSIAKALILAAWYRRGTWISRGLAATGS